MGIINIYMIVTNDEYEFPVQCDLSSREVAEFLHTTIDNVRYMVRNPSKKAKYKVVVMGRKSFDKRSYQKKYRMTHDRSEYFRERYRRLKHEEIERD